VSALRVQDGVPPWVKWTPDVGVGFASTGDVHTRATPSASAAVARVFRTFPPPVPILPIGSV
jgi:hypothetical protein